MISYVRTISLAICLVCLNASGSVAQDSPWLAYSPSVVRLQGKLIKVQKFGKPSYGESPEKDERVEIAVLILNSPIRVKGSSASSVNHQSATNLSFVQAIFPAEMELTYPKHFDQEITLAGNLLRGRKGDHFTDVVIEVKAVNPTGKPLY